MCKTMKRKVGGRTDEVTIINHNQDRNKKGKQGSKTGQTEREIKLCRF